MDCKKAVIPAAGFGTRFLPATKVQPKEMLPIVDKPTIQFVVEEAVNSGIDDILIITGKSKRAIEDHFDKAFELEARLKRAEQKELLKHLENIPDSVDIHYIRQKEQKGLGHAILCAEKHVGSETFAVLLGDTVVENHVPCTKQLMKMHSKYDASVIAVEEVSKEKLQRYGIISGKEVEGGVYKIDKIVEKPKPENAPSNLGAIGRYVLDAEIFDLLHDTKPGVGNEIQLSDALTSLCEKRDMYAAKFDGRRYDIGNKLDYIKAIIEFALRREDMQPELKDYIKTLL